MSRSILLPLLGLVGIILYGTTQAARPPYETETRVEMDAPPPIRQPAAARPPARRTPASSPPPAPRLRSEVEAEAARADSAASEPEAVRFDGASVADGS